MRWCVGICFILTEISNINKRQGGQMLIYRNMIYVSKCRCDAHL